MPEYVTIRHNVPDAQKAKWKADHAQKSGVRGSHGILGSAITNEGPGFIEVTHRIDDMPLAIAHGKSFDSAGERNRMGAQNKFWP